MRTATIHKGMPKIITDDEQKPKEPMGEINKAIWSGVKAGAKLTISQWAKQLGVSRGSISHSLGNLRNRGFFVYPVGGYTRPATKEFQEGVLVDIMERKAWFNEVMLRNKTVRLMPSLKRFTQHVETASLALPEMLKELEQEAKTVFGVFDEVQKYTQKQLVEHNPKK